MQEMTGNNRAWEMQCPWHLYTMCPYSTWCSSVSLVSLCLFSVLHRFNHGSCAECCWLLRPHPVCVPCIVARGRSPAADHQPVGADEPRGCSPVPGPGSHQLLLHLRPQSDETPTLLRGIKGVSHFMIDVVIKWVLALLHPMQSTELCIYKGWINIWQPLQNKIQSSYNLINATFLSFAGTVSQRSLV